MKEIKLEEIANSSGVFRSLMNSQQQKCVLELMKEACRQTLELAAENAEIVPCNCQIDGKTSVEMSLRDGRFVIVNKHSILETINQIV